MTREEKENALHCLKVMIDEEVCEECNLYGTTGTDHCEKDCVRVAIQALQKEPSEDCISRQRVLDIVEFNRNSYDGNDAVVWIEREIKELPSVQPEPKTGHWITRIDDKGQFIGYKCSKCGGKKIGDEGEWVELIDYKYQYCPNCGAKMEAE